jgi:hypothetical protein
VYVIMTGNPADGFQVILDELGRPFPDVSVATEAAEECDFTEPWWVVQALPMDAEDPELGDTDDLPGPYVVAVYFLGDEGAWHYHATWSGDAPNDSTAESLALDAIEDVRIDGWKTEIIRRPEPS